ncbi:hypothetical protein SPAN111604_07915 [Sphingomonas antarctica]
MAKPDPEALAKALRENLRRRKDKVRDMPPPPQKNDVGHKS